MQALKLFLIKRRGRAFHEYYRIVKNCHHAICKQPELHHEWVWVHGWNCPACSAILNGRMKRPKTPEQIKRDKQKALFKKIRDKKTACKSHK